MRRGKEPPQGAELGLERIVFFSGAVMAIAITLLAVEIQVPEISPDLASAELPHQLVALAPRFVGLAISFLYPFRSHSSARS